MGDVPPQASSPTEYTGQDVVGPPRPRSDPTALQSVAPQVFHAPSGFPPQFPPHAFASQFDMTQPQASRAGPGPYNMNTMMGALPQAGYRQGPRFGQTPPSANMVGPMQPVSPYAAQAQYYMQPYYGGAPLSPSHQQGGGIPTRAPMGYYPSQMIMGQQPPQPQQTTPYYYSQPAQFPAQVMSDQMLAVQYPSSTPPQAKISNGDHAGSTPFTQPQDQAPATPGENRSNIVRGPPRKPRQSGHAIWIGNLPPQTDLMSLVHHICREASGLQSLFLISKSNCAFANFKDEPSCLAAQQKVHDSKFQSVRLVSRLRKNTVEGASGVTAPTGPVALATQQAAPRSPNAEETNAAPSALPTPATTEDPGPAVRAPPPQKEKFFILKSLTVEDLDLSVRTGVWATQAHNERSLNDAFKTADHVYLVFSANKSGEYFGYARMLSPINEDPAAVIEFAPSTQTSEGLDLPKAIPTESTEFAPKGRIIDDSARGTIFWEVEQGEVQGDTDGVDHEEGGSVGDTLDGGEPGEVDDTSSAKSGQETGESKAWGKPFRLEWLSTARLPFYRTRGLRNPWNSNREVKIARDGTELEPSVGRRLIGLFSRVQNQNSAQGLNSSMGPGLRQGPVPMPSASLPVAVPMPMIPGYPPMRPPYQQ